MLLSKIAPELLFVLFKLYQVISLRWLWATLSWWREASWCASALGKARPLP